MKLSNKWDKRKGVAGVFSAVILFGMLFTVGFSFYQAAITDQTTSANAYSQRLLLQAQANHENLTLKAGNGAGFLWLMINNTGGIDSVVTSVYVSSLSGQIRSVSSTGSPFLSTSADLGQSLPLTFDPGVSTSAVGGNLIIPSAALPGCVISSSGCNGQTVYVSVLTKLGNIFSVPFPFPNSVTEENILVNQGLLNEYLVSQEVLSVNQMDIIGGCTGCVNGYYAGGNILGLLLTALPSPVQQGDPITVSATVSDYSAYAANSVTVTLYAIYTGSATVTPDISGTSPNYQCGSISTVTSSTPQTITCTFSANEGKLGGGSVTFVGVATACIATGTGTNSPCSASSPGTPAESSVSSSNPVQVGAAVSFGLWQPNFYVFYYTGCSSSSHCVTLPSCWTITQYCSAGVLSNSEEYVAIYVQVTNVGTSPLTLLDGSYMQSVSPNVEFDLFMACSGVQASICNFKGYSTGASYSASLGTINPYGCADSAPSAPTAPSGQTCLTVAQGQSVTLMFVANAPDSYTFEWGSTNPGSTGGSNAAILLDFAACTSAPSVCSSGSGTYAAASQQIPFEGVVVTS